MAEHPRIYGICRPDGSPYPAEDLPSSRALRGEVVLGEEILFCQPSGRRVPAIVNTAPIHDASGRLTGAVLVLQDISHIKELERQREEFVSVVAHDLRDAMSGIHGYADYLMRPATRESLPDAVQRALEVIYAGSRRMRRMISDLLDASRLEARQLTLIKKSIDIPTLLRDIVERSGQLTKGHSVTVQVQGAVPAVEVDPDRIEQVLGNLLSNAAKYSFPDSGIAVQVESLPDEVVISVTNAGQGISPEDQEKLFTRFHRTRLAQEEAPGLGLGLYISKGLVEAHGGRIWVESEPGKSTTFRFTLPTKD